MVRYHENQPPTTQAPDQTIPPAPVPEQEYEVTSALNPNKPSHLRLVALIMGGDKQRLGGHILTADKLRSRSV
ncbi:MAG TPA: hypothetical protein VN778_02090 [Verrucomicrobiae bacterium]|nr:hypothetical protein [Verrucomicrobiae bacterium]